MPGKLWDYQIPNAYCNARQTPVIPIQQQAPIISGFPPVFISLIMSVFKPIAAIAITIKNLLKVFNGLKTSGEIPFAVATVVIIEARIKYRIKNGNICLRDIFCSDCRDAFLVRINASTSVIGIIASVLVSFTVTALSSVSVPRFSTSRPRLMLLRLRKMYHSLLSRQKFQKLPLKMC